MWVPRHQTLARGPNVSLLWLFALLSYCNIPTPGSLWDWITFLLEANAQKWNTRPSLSSCHQAGLLHTLGWEFRSS